MAGLVQKMSRVISGVWQSVSGQPKAPERGFPEVIVHDPEASKPHDLDDPFFDRGVRSRMADVIANTGTKAPPEG